MSYSWRLMDSAPKKLLKKPINSFLKENNDLVLPQAIPCFLTESECDKIIEQSRSLVEEPGSVDLIGVTKLRDSRIKWLFPDPQTEWIFAKLDALVERVNRYYQYELFGFFDGVQIASYESSGHYGWHIDIGKKNQSNRKLSVSVQLSHGDEYEGGDLEFMCIPEKSPRAKGTAIVFPAFLYHKVHPVTAGLRHSMVSWISGPPFR